MTHCTGRSMLKVQPWSTRWAVFLGCTTAKRLALEMGISEKSARKRLCNATAYDFITRESRGMYRAQI